jgi:hypothetical protein
MVNGKNIWIWAAAALLCTTIASSYLALNYQTKTVQLQKDYEALLEDLDDLTISINLKIDYGGDNVVWHNETRVPLDANLLTATQLLASIEYTTSDFGSFVTEIDDIGGDPDTYWLWHYFDEDTDSWKYGPSGADQWVLHNGDIVSWVYTSY